MYTYAQDYKLKQRYSIRTGISSAKQDSRANIVMQKWNKKINTGHSYQNEAGLTCLRRAPDRFVVDDIELLRDDGLCNEDGSQAKQKANDKGNHDPSLVRGSYYAAHFCPAPAWLYSALCH